MAPLPYQLGSAAAMPSTRGSSRRRRAWTFVLVWARMNPAPPDPAPQAGRFFLSHIRSLRFAYFGRLPSDAAMTWHDGWSVEMAFPRSSVSMSPLAPGQTPDRDEPVFRPALRHDWKLRPPPLRTFDPPV